VGYGVLYSCVQVTQSHPHLAPNPEAHEYTYLSVPRVIKRNQEESRGNKREQEESRGNKRGQEGTRGDTAWGNIATSPPSIVAARTITQC
jgi:hypothetical protein